MRKLSFGATVVLLLTSILHAQSVSSDSSSGSPPTSTTKGQSPSAVSFGQDGLVFSNADESAKLRVHGVVQGDGRFFSSDLKGNSPDRLLWRRTRPIFEGTVFKVLDFRFMPDFAQNNPLIQEVYLELNVLPFAKPRVGKCKTPLHVGYGSHSARRNEGDTAGTGQKFPS